MAQKLLHVGFGNMVVAERVVAPSSPGSAPIRPPTDGAREAGAPAERRVVRGGLLGEASLAGWPRQYRRRGLPR